MTLTRQQFERRYPDLLPGVPYRSVNHVPYRCETCADGPSSCACCAGHGWHWGLPPLAVNGVAGVIRWASDCDPASPHGDG